MAIAHRDTQKNSAVASSVAVTKPTGTVDGDLLVAVVYSGGVTGAPVGWTQGRDVNPGASAHVTTYYKVASGEGASFTFTGTSLVGAIVSCFSGAAASSPFDVSSAWRANASSTSVTADGVTTTQANDLLIFCGYSPSSSRTFTPPSGMTEPTNGELVIVGGASLELAYLLDAGAPGATGDKVATLDVANINNATLTAFKLPSFSFAPPRRINTLVRM